MKHNVNESLQNNPYATQDGTSPPIDFPEEENFYHIKYYKLVSGPHKKLQPTSIYRLFGKKESIAIDYTEKNRHKKTSFLWGLKSQVGCKRCGLDDYRVLEFHHKNRKTKKFNLDLGCACRSWGSILNEIKKCIILCRNCHRIEEFEEETIRINKIK